MRPMILRNEHLSPEQVAILKEFQQFPERPTYTVYNRFSKRMAAVSPKLPKPKDIPNTRQGYNSNEVVKLPTFNAQRDLPVGVGLSPCFDSGGNCRITDAGSLVLCNMWNQWSDTAPTFIIKTER